jgi:hypothetical protein
VVGCTAGEVKLEAESLKGKGRAPNRILIILTRQRRGSSTTASRIRLVPLFCFRFRPPVSRKKPLLLRLRQLGVRVLGEFEKMVHQKFILKKKRKMSSKDVR